MFALRKLCIIVVSWIQPRVQHADTSNQEPKALQICCIMGLLAITKSNLRVTLVAGGFSVDPSSVHIFGFNSSALQPQRQLFENFQFIASDITNLMRKVHFLQKSDF